jgi:hypothetical protein
VGRSDADGDGVVDNLDGCPAIPGPAENNGCPVPVDVQPEPGPVEFSHPDADGDGIFDPLDACPLQFGLPDKGGCPPEDDSAEESTQPFTPRWIPAEGACSVVANHPEGVNVRKHFSTQAPIVGVLEPDQLYPITAAYYQADKTWYLLADPAGFVLSDVVILGGQCEGLIEVCVHDLPDEKSEPESATMESPSDKLTSTVDNNDESDVGCDAEQNLPQLGGPQLGLADDTMDWVPLCYLGLTGDLSIGVSVESMYDTWVYEEPFDEEPLVGEDGFPTGNRTGEILDGPVCRDGIIMWKVVLRSDSPDDSVAGWVFYHRLRPIPD